MGKQTAVSAGLLLFKNGRNGLEFFLAHPGGPFWASKDAGAWTIPKGMVELDEELLAAACREFEEETGIIPKPPFLPLGSVRLKSGKLVHAWAWQGEADPEHVTSNMTRMEWPRSSGRWLKFPEVDRCAWFDLGTSKVKINKAQVDFLERLSELLARTEPRAST